MTQNDQILKRLKRRPITSLQAIHLYGCTRLSARIYDLRAMGHAITGKRVSVRDRNGRECRVAQYRMA